MARVVQYSTTHGPIYIEVSGAETHAPGTRKATIGDSTKDYVNKAAATFEDALANAFMAANAFVENASKLHVRPNELNIEFGLKISGEFDLFVVSGNSEANFVIKMKWSGNGTTPAS
jgi:hypothetical protein